MRRERPWIEKLPHLCGSILILSALWRYTLFGFWVIVAKVTRHPRLRWFPGVATLAVKDAFGNGTCG